MSKGGYGTNEAMTGIKSPLLRKCIKFIYPPMPTLNIISKNNRETINRLIFDNDKILNIGSGADSGCGRWLWKNQATSNPKFINLDITISTVLSVQGDAHLLPLKDKSVDAVIMQALLEHVTSPSEVVKEAFRVLKPGGILYVEVPFLQGFHADPHDYQRYTLPGLKVLLSDFEEIVSGVSVGPFCSFVWLIRDGFSSCFNNKMLFNLSRFLLAWILSPIRYFDYIARSNPSAERLANEFFFLCKKSS